MYTKLWGKYCFLNFLVISYIQPTFGCCVMVEPKPITSIFSHIRGRTGLTQKRVYFEVHEDLLYYLRFRPAIPSASIFPPSSPPHSHPSHSVTPPVHPVTPLVHPVNPCITLKHPLLHPVTILLTLFTLVHSVTPSYPLLHPVTPYDISATPCYARCTPSNTPTPVTSFYTPATSYYIPITPWLGCCIHIFVFLFFTDLLHFHKMDYTVFKLGWQAKCTWLFSRSMSQTFL